jgi:hypothetical protein
MKTDETLIKKTEVLQLKIEPSQKALLIAKCEAQGVNVSQRVRLLIRRFLSGK